MVNFKRIETFYWAARLNSFTAAAAKLYATQSTVSMRIQELENEFGVKLFDRRLRTVRVTEAGRELMTYAERLLSLAQEMRERVAAPESLQGTIRLGVSEVVSITWLAQLVHRIHSEFPQVRVELEEALTLDLMAEFDEGRLDLVLAPYNFTRPDIVKVELGSVHFSWMVGQSLEVPDQLLSPLDIQKLPIIALSKKSSHHRPIGDWFAAGGAKIWRMDTCKSMNVAAALAEKGLGITLLPNICYQEKIDSGKLRVVKAKPDFPRVEFHAMFARNTTTSLNRRIALISRDVSDFRP